MRNKPRGHCLAARACIVAVAASAALASGGCGALLGQAQTETVTRYDFAPDLPPPAAVHQDLRIYVAAPSAATDFASTRMAYTKRRFELDYFARSQWAAEPAALLEPWLVQALDASRAFASVSAGVNSPLADLRLNTEILTLRQEFTTTPSQAHIVIRVQLVDVARRRIVASKILHAVEPATSDDAYGGVAAVNRALGRILRELVEFCIAGASEVKPRLSEAAGKSSCRCTLFRT